MKTNLNIWLVMFMLLLVMAGVIFAGQMEDWLINGTQQPGDLNRDGIVDIADYAKMANDWQNSL